MIKTVIRDQFITLGFCSLWGPVAAALCLKDQSLLSPKGGERSRDLGREQSQRGNVDLFRIHSRSRHSREGGDQLRNGSELALNRSVLGFPKTIPGLLFSGDFLTW